MLCTHKTSCLEQLHDSNHHSSVCEALIILLDAVVYRNWVAGQKVELMLRCEKTSKSNWWRVKPS